MSRVSGSHPQVRGYHRFCLALGQFMADVNGGHTSLCPPWDTVARFMQELRFNSAYYTGAYLASVVSCVVRPRIARPPAKASPLWLGMCKASSGRFRRLLLERIAISASAVLVESAECDVHLSFLLRLTRTCRAPSARVGRIIIMLGVSFRVALIRGALCNTRLGGCSGPPRR